MDKKLANLIFLLSIILVSCQSKSGRLNKDLEPGFISGKVISIIDGDTFDILLQDNTTIRIRMEGIDAPEKGMPFYQVSKKFLSKLCINKKVKIEKTGIDGNRIIGYSYLDDGTEISQKMIKAGLAWHFKKFNSDSLLSNLEIEARNLKKGLWIEQNPMPPWTNRNLHRQGISTKDSFKIQENN